MLLTKNRNNMEVTRTSQLTGIQHTFELDVTEEQLSRFENRRENGEYVQSIFPNLSRDWREFILTGITPKEWDDMFGGGDE
jgi:hypothetical protein